jgi:glycosyltransferase involved in cell wall biosynthesis
LLTTNLHGGDGWSSYARQVALALHKLGVEVVALAHDRADDLPFTQVPCLPPMPSMGRKRVLSLWGARHSARQALAGCDVVHVMAEPYAPLGAWLAGKRPLFLTAHGTYVNLPRMTHLAPFHWLYRWAFAQSQLICVSHYTQAIAAQVLPRQRAHVILNGVAPDDVPYTPDTPKSGRIVLTSGGVKARKGTLYVVRAMAKVRDVLPDVRCFVVGKLDESAPYTRQVRAEIARLGLQDTVTLTGFVPRETLQAYYQQADAFVLPSINDGYSFEGFGLVHLQASLAGLPTIGTRGCGVEDAIRDGETGLLLAQEGLDDTLAPALLRLLTRPDLAHAMGQKGRAYALTQSWDGVAQALLALYGGKA